MKWFLDVMRNKYATFSGRARRSEFWYFQLVNQIILFGFQIVLLLVFLPVFVGYFSFAQSTITQMNDSTAPSTMQQLTPMAGISVGMWIILAIYSVYGLVVMIPSFAVTVRRLHDTGRSGWYVLLPYIPIPLVNFVCLVILLVFLCEDSKPGANEYGANPKESMSYSY